MDVNQSDTKKTYIEFLRIAAAFLVIVNHTNSHLLLSLGPSLTWFCSLTYFFICKVAVPLFLFIMGALLLGKEDTPKKTWARIYRILVVFVVSSLLYYIFLSRVNGTPLVLWRFLPALVKGPITDALWYFYLYLALLLMLPILQKLIKVLNKRHLQYLLFFSLVVTGTASLLTIFVPRLWLSDYFTVGLIGPYIGLVLLGYYLEEYVPMKRPVFWGAFAVFIALIAFQVGGSFYLYRRNPSFYLLLDDRTLITITAASAAFYICAKYLFTKHPPRPWLSNVICRFGRLTLGIYLLGDGVIYRTRFIFNALSGYIHPMAAMVLWELLVFAICALVTAALRLIPFLRKFL